jgi:hypothetical protein
VSLVTKCVTGDFLQLTFNDVGRGGREGRGGRVKKCFLSLRQTALLLAEGKKRAREFVLGRKMNEFSLPSFLPAFIDSCFRLFIHTAGSCRFGGGDLGTAQQTNPSQILSLLRLHT